jgi:hypothetical protein
MMLPERVTQAIVTAWKALVRMVPAGWKAQVN